MLSDVLLTCLFYDLYVSLQEFIKNLSAQS